MVQRKVKEISVDLDKTLNQIFGVDEDFIKDAKYKEEAIFDEFTKSINDAYERIKSTDPVKFLEKKQELLKMIKEIEEEQKDKEEK